MSSEIEVLNKTEEEFYKDASKYWSDIPATIDGMLGGFGYISEIDIKGSKLLLKQLFNSRNPPGKEYALDCGAGIGRITKYLLTEIFSEVDMVEQNPVFLEKAKIYLAHKKVKVFNFFPIGLQSFEPHPKKYDVIWIQWVIGHLTDSDLIKFLERCKYEYKKHHLLSINKKISISGKV